MTTQSEIGERLRQFGESRFETMAEFARALGISPQNLNAYLSGRRLPGNKMERKLKELGCDIVWLLHGESREELNKRFENIILRKAKELREEDFKMIEILKSRGINSVEQLEKFFELSRAAYSLARVAEEVKKYEGKKKSPKRQGGKP